MFINTASVAATDGQQGQSAYSASKAGVVGMYVKIEEEGGEEYRAREIGDLR